MLLEYLNSSSRGRTIMYMHQNYIKHSQVMLYNNTPITRFFLYKSIGFYRILIVVLGGGEMRKEELPITNSNIFLNIKPPWTPGNSH